MSGPIDETDRAGANFGVSAVEVKEGRSTHIGDLGILRVLPTKQRRTVGPWCFVDLMSPDDVERPPRLEIGPHPHIGLATVTWLFGGSVLHTDSLGTEQGIRPGELNLMTAGHGVAHAEEGLHTIAPAETGGIMGVQMWLAQPEGTRNGPSSFHHVKDLPEVEIGSGDARILIGEYGGTSSDIGFDHPVVGLDVTFRAPTTIETNPGFEYGVAPVNRPMRVEDAIVDPGSLALVPTGYDALRLETRGGVGRVMVLGGVPFGEPIKMWWNFVARTDAEITEAWRDWQTHNEDRFGTVPSSLSRIDSPRPPWLGRGD
jgi:redox-sensitive bicupin YhaK (pirin superfamily)